MRDRNRWHNCGVTPHVVEPAPANIRPDELRRRREIEARHDASVGAQLPGESYAAKIAREVRDNPELLKDVDDNVIAGAVYVSGPQHAQIRRTVVEAGTQWVIYADAAGDQWRVATGAWLQWAAACSAVITGGEPPQRAERVTMASKARSVTERHLWHYVNDAGGRVPINHAAVQLGTTAEWLRRLAHRCKYLGTNRRGIVIARASHWGKHAKD